MMVGTRELIYRDPGARCRVWSRPRRPRRTVGGVAPMSSHREAPEIAKDPVADSTDLYAFVSPDAPEHRHAHRQLRPARGSGRRPELLRVRRRRAVRNPDRQRRRRQSRDRLRVRVPERSRATTTRSCTTPARSDSLDSPNWNRRQFYNGHARRRAHRSRDGARPAPGVPAEQRRSALDARTMRIWRTPPSTRCPAAARCSPASAAKASTSTSARSSTWAPCDPSRTCT